MVTLVIEDDTIRVTQIQGKNVRLAVSLPLERGLVKDGLIKDTNTVSQLIKELFRAHRITEDQVVVAISSIHAIYRASRMPKLADNVISEAVRYEMVRMTALPLDELYTSWQVITVSDVETAVPMIGIPKETADATLETLNKAGLNCKLMDIKPLAAARVIDTKQAIVINVESTSFDIVVVSDGLPEIARSLVFSSPDIDDTVKASEVLEELKRTVAFFNSNRQAGLIDSSTPAFISGQLHSIVLPLLDYPVSPLPIFLNHPEGFAYEEYVVNVGLALKQMRLRKDVLRVNINVMPQVYLPKPVPLFGIIYTLLIILAAGGLYPFVTTMMEEINQTSVLRLEVTELSASLEETKIEATDTKEFEELEKKLKKITADHSAIAGSLDAFQSRQNRINADFGQITSLLPGTVDISSIHFGGSWNVSGVAPNQELVMGYVRSLETNGGFTYVIIDNLEQLEFDNWRFTLVMR
jgi:hypothetical protein